MNSTTTGVSLRRKLQFSGGLIIAGLLLEAICVTLKGALPFVAFVTFGGLLLAAGVVLYLWSLASLKAE